MTLAPSRAMKALVYVNTPLVNILPDAPPEGLSPASRQVAKIVGSATPTPLNDHSGFTHQDASAVALSSYDEVVIDLGLALSSETQVSTVSPTETYRMLQLAGRKFWPVIRCDGYGQPALATRDKALTAAKTAMASIYADCLSFQIDHLLAGFAILEPNLNVVFADDTGIDRQFQNQLVGACHGTYSRPGMIVTSRPADAVVMSGPLVPGSAESGLSLIYPEIGRRLQFVDVLVCLYPEPSPITPNMSVIVAQAQACMAAYGINRSPRAATIDWGLILTAQNLSDSPDEVGGTLAPPTSYAALARVAALAGALGMTRVAVQSDVALALAEPPSGWLPSDERVNTSKEFAASSRDGVLSVEYVDSNATRVKRRFNTQTFDEMV